MQISFLTSADISRAAQLIASLKLFKQYDYTLEKISVDLKQSINDERNDVIVAKDGDEICGVAWVIKDGGFARSPYLKLIAVSEKREHNGIGKKLMDELERRHLKSNGFILLVTTTNTAARRFYEELGYRCVGEIPNFVKKGFSESIYFEDDPDVLSKLKRAEKEIKHGKYATWKGLRTQTQHK